MWKTRSNLKDELIESLQRENAALRVLLSASGIALPVTAQTSPVSTRSTPSRKRTADDVYRATRQTRLSDQLKRDQEQEPEAPASPDPSANSNA